MSLSDDVLVIPLPPSYPPLPLPVRKKAFIRRAMSLLDFDFDGFRLASHVFGSLFPSVFNLSTKHPPTHVELMLSDQKQLPRPVVVVVRVDHNFALTFSCIFVP
jgi:hypothetical protein